MTTGLPFPDGFLWGAATSAQQIEGARRAGGRGDSIWDAFAARPGAIEDGSTPDVTCDHYHRWPQDLDLMAGLGLGASRFSLAWPRIQPTGRGAALTAGLDFYDALVDGLLERGIRPFPTLYHWDLPQTLQDAGGWTNRETSALFAEYAALAVRRLGDRVTDWTTLNEPWCAAHLGHEQGCHAPGLTDPAAALAAAHHLLLGHGLAAAAIRAERPAARVGIVQIHCPAHAATDSEADREAARWFDGFFNRWYLDPVLRGAYPEDHVADRVALGHLPGLELPFVQDGDLAAMSAPLDFLGINYYSRNVMRAGADGRPEQVQQVPAEELTQMGWEVYPDGLRESLLRVHRDYAPAELYVTEFGAAFDDPLGAGGRIADARRVDYLLRHLTAAHEAIAAGVPLRGCFVWSLLDNWEWALGFAKRFGLYAVDPATLRRTPKDSAYWYREVARNNAVPAVAVTRTGGETP
ncbi:MAG TPA: GH1 family beta-glucosidase [Candidatus Krumholzibacteria bacterium]|nr:GH1 family beta-glucosidase [Candidatus Krumholzibacteria bacterium]HRX51405.1 GH1 family beta-glucosidase [Candidatus Krumholzibacteria bacterium]